MEGRKERLSVYELERRLKAMNPTQISYCSDNQEWWNSGDPFFQSVKFLSMEVIYEPSTVVLEHESGYTYLRRVKYAEMGDECVLGTPITICCASHKDAYDEGTVRYTLFAS